MAIDGYCGKMKCCDCSSPCRLDEEIPCSPDCSNLDGQSIKIAQCLKAGCEEVKHIFNMQDCSDEEILAVYGEETLYPY